MAKDEKKKHTPVTDPLEASKIPTKPSAPTPPVSRAPAPVVAAPAAAEPTRAPAKRYRVVQDTTISLHSQLVKLNKDDIVSEASYGPLGMQRIMESNVALMALTDE